MIWENYQKLNLTSPGVIFHDLFFSNISHSLSRNDCKVKISIKNPLSSTTLDDSLTLQWESTQHTTGDTINYFINYYFELENILSDTSAAIGQTAISYSLLDIYENMVDFEPDTVRGYWWVNAADVDDTLNSSNGPSELTIITDQTLTS